MPQESLISITQESDLNAFLTTATLANADFTAVVNQTVNSFLLSKEEETRLKKKHDMYQDQIRIPRRPFWDSSTTPEQLDAREKEAFLEWRRSLVVLEEEKNLLMTPYERNIQVWRQLWRVLERSDLVVQIVDARNPLMFRCEDVEHYVREINPAKQNLLLLNKADLLSKHQRRVWAEYFTARGIEYRFFSAALANIAIEEEMENAADGSSTNKNKELHQLSKEYHEETESQPDSPDSPLDEESIRILSANDLIDLISKATPTYSPEKVTIGFVGYPNVGKSSTMNALIGTKKVTVSSTPGKTKHFQTIHISEGLVLCDCPGLVFPMFATTKADMVTNGILPIDQLREHTGPSGLLTMRIPKHVLESVYGIKIPLRNEEEDPDRLPTAEEFLRPYALSRGFKKAGQGNPDEARAARAVLKDYVNGKLLYVFPPPEMDESLLESFKADSVKRMLWCVSQRKSKATVHQPTGLETAFRDISVDEDKNSKIEAGVVGKFTEKGFRRVQLYPHQISKEDQKHARSESATLRDKKHKKGKKGKTRDNWTQDYDY